MIEGSLMHWGDKRMANVTMISGRKELSLTVDNGSLCETEKLFRADLRCTSKGRDVTADVFNCGEFDVVRGDVQNMATAMNWLQRSEWGFSR